MDTIKDKPAIQDADVMSYKYIIIGGGIAGVTCAETLSSLCHADTVLLLTASPLIKAVTNYRKVTRALEEFDVEERPMFQLGEDFPNIVVKHQKVAKLNTNDKTVTTEDKSTYKYDKLCLCTGGLPKVIAAGNPFVLGIRDTETAKVFQKRLKNASRIVVVGNGGIATELVYEVEGCEVIWAIKDSSINSTFIDAGAAKFFEPILQKNKLPPEGPLKRTKYKINDGVHEVIHAAKSDQLTDTPGSALGPDWHEGLTMKGKKQVSHQVEVVYQVEVACILTPEDVKHSRLKTEVLFEKEEQDQWPVYVKLTNQKVYGCDFIVSATGVIPNIHPFTDGGQFSISEEDGGINVNDKMQTSVQDVYAAGDVCHANWVKSPFWMQMRLWSQARQMGAYAARCMVAVSHGEEITLDFCFELFAHVTRFFNYKVVLLGRFNGQGLGDNQELLVRVSEGKEYIKVVLKDGRMHGALMIGDTDMEETFENLILNGMDLTAFKDDLLNPNIDIEDFFD